MINYILQVSLSWAAFYAIYWLFLRKETFFQLNRFYLLATLIISLAIPYLQLPIMASETIPIAPLNLVEIDIYATNTLNMAETNSGSRFDWMHIAWWIYGLIAFGFLCRFLFNIAQIYNLYASGNKVKNKDYYLVENDLMHIPFSFFRYLFFSKKMDLLPEERQQIIQHEEAHIQQKHSIDVILIELLQILFWFNPIISLYKRAIKENHEYLADQAVIQYNSKKNYGRLLLGQSNPGIRIALANNFNYSQLKNRILMMTRQQSSGKARYKILLAVPVFLMATILFANRTISNDISKSSKDSPIPVLDTIPPPPPPPPPPPASAKGNGFYDIYRMVEEMPYMKECEGVANKKERKTCSDKAIINFIVKNLKYPAEARKNGIEGTAVITFIIGKDGTPTDFKLVRDPGAGTGEEALRVVSMLPKWVPGKQRGKAVRVQFNMPVRFKLGKEEAKKSPTPKKSSLPIKAIKSDGDVYRIVEQMPYMKGCESLATMEEKKACSDKKILNFIQQNLRYPKAAREQEVEGMSVIKFIVEKDGSISNTSILRNPGAGTGEEALRVVSAMPNWNPGIRRGKPVRVQFLIPVRFKLTPKEKEKTAPSIQKTLELSKFKLFPNPASSSINVQFQSKQNTPVYLKVVDMNGKVLWSAKEASFSGSMNKTIDLGVASGTYYLVIEQDDKSVSKAFVIQQ